MNQPTTPRLLALVTGASTGIGYQLALCCARNGYDLLIAADEPEIETSATRLRQSGVNVEAIQADLSNIDGVAKLHAAAADRPVELLIANAGRGLGKAFLDQDFDAAREVVDTNVTGTLALLHKVAREMRDRGRGRILITGSIAGHLPGSFQAVYNGSKAFLDSFSFALREELKDSGVTVTCLMPGATDTAFFERAGMLDTKVAAEPKDDPAMVAQAGFEAMMQGKPSVITGLRNKLQVAAAHVMPSTTLARMHRKQAAPGTARDAREGSAMPPAKLLMGVGGLLGGALLGALLWNRGRGTRLHG